MATFTEIEIKQMWSLFNLDREQLKPGSIYRQAVTDLEQFDVDHGQDLVADAKEILTQITTLKENFADERATGQGAVQSLEIIHQVSTTFGDSISQSQSTATQINELINELKSEKFLNLSAYINTSNQTQVLGIEASGIYRGSSVVF